MEIKRLGVKNGTILQISFLNWKEYQSFYLLFRDYIEDLEKNNIRTNFEKNILQSISMSRKSNDDFPVILNLKPSIYYDAFLALYTELLTRNEKDEYKKAYEEVLELNKKYEETLEKLQKEVEETFLSQEYEIKTLKRKLRKYENDDEE